MESYNTYKLTNGKTKGSYQIPLKFTRIEKIVDGISQGLRNIKYVSGLGSYWAEDVPSDMQSESIWFENGLLIVPKSDKLLNSLMQDHPWFEKGIYELYDKKNNSKKELDTYRAKDEAIKLIDESDTQKRTAIALAIFGQPAFDWDDDTCELELRKYADQRPDKLKEELSSRNYESKYLAALAFNKGVVKANIGKNAVIWNDTTEGVILRLAKGENGITKLGELLSTRTDETELILQEISIRAKKSELPKQDLQKELSEKDKEIAELRAQLLGKQIEPVNEELEEAKLAYKQKFDKNVPPNMKNNLEWILTKLDE